MSNKLDWATQSKRTKIAAQRYALKQFEQDFPDVLYLYYDQANRPISRERWLSLRYHQHRNGFRIGRTNTRGGHIISTVWQGIDQSMPWETKPVVFETMVFCDHGETAATHTCPIDIDQWRYSSLKDARKGHNVAVNYVRHLEARKATQ